MLLVAQQVKNSPVNTVIISLFVFLLIRYGQHFQRSVIRHLQHIHRAIANINFSTRSNRVLQATGTQQFSNLLQLRHAMFQECLRHLKKEIRVASQASPSGICGTQRDIGLGFSE
jgi:hypothetical protein